MTSSGAELAAVDRYCDAVPRSAATVEEHGTLLLFVPTEVSLHPRYARPSGAGPVTTTDLDAVLRPQRELRLPQAVEWVDGRPDGLDALAAAAVAQIGFAHLGTEVGDTAEITAVARVYARLGFRQIGHALAATA